MNSLHEPNLWRSLHLLKEVAVVADCSGRPVDDLEVLAEARFERLSQAELTLLRVAPKGEVAWCGPIAKNDDPAKADEWGPQREIRAELIRWLCVDRDAASIVDPRGIQVHAARIIGVLDLSFVSVPFPLLLRRCCFTDDATLTSSHLPALSFEGSRVLSISADDATVSGGVFLRNGFCAKGVVRLHGVQIGGDLDCCCGTFKNPGNDALTANNANVKCSVLLNCGFHAEGEVRLLGARIGGNLDCSHGTFKNPDGNALSAIGADVEGSVYLCHFSAEGKVWLRGAQIGGDLDCCSGSLSEVIAENAAISGTLFWQGVKATSLYLTNTSAGSLDDDESWPAGKEKLSLDGFVYGHILGNNPRDAKMRLRWLQRQDPFRPKPYRQLAKVLRDAGEDGGARKVLFQMERQRRQVEDRSWYARLWGRALKWTIGYGFYPWWALGWLVLLTALGWGLFRFGYSSGAMAPTDKDAYCFFRTQARPPDYYQRFTASVYSLENSLPFFNLGQKDYWTPDPNPQVSRRMPGCLRWFRWGQILLGWLFATLFVVGVSGVVRKE